MRGLPLSVFASVVLLIAPVLLRGTAAAQIFDAGTAISEQAGATLTHDLPRVSHISGADWMVTWRAQDTTHSAPFAYYRSLSRDHGATWAAPVRVTERDYTAVPGAGSTLMARVRRPNGCDLMRSEDGGRQWATVARWPIECSILDSQIETDRKGNWVALLYVASADWRLTKIHVAFSHDDGRTWQGPKQLFTGFIIAEPQLATDGVGGWIVAMVGARTWDWGDIFEPGPRITRLTYVSSADNGREWSAPITLASADAGESSGRLGNLAIDANANGEWYALWTDYRDSFDSDAPWELVTVGSHDAGRTWSSPQIIDELAPGVAGSESPARLTSSAGGRVLAVWPGQDLWYYSSVDGGPSWSTRRTLNPSGPSPVILDRDIEAATDGQGHWLAVWTTLDKAIVSAENHRLRRSQIAAAAGGLCGDLVVSPSEDCDDGNRVGDDGCPATCRLPHAPQPDPCLGDCNGDHEVRVDELVRAVNIALGSQPVDGCRIVDANLDGSVKVNEVVTAVNSLLVGCPMAPTPTPEGTQPYATLPIPQTPVPTPTPDLTNRERHCLAPLAAPLAATPAALGDGLYGYRVSSDIVVGSPKIVREIAVAFEGLSEAPHATRVELRHEPTGTAIRLLDNGDLDWPGFPGDPLYHCYRPLAEETTPLFDDFVQTNFYGYFHLRFGDDGSSLQAACHPDPPNVRGRLRPAQALAAFTGAPLAGVWTLSLSVVTDSPFDEADAFLIDWCLEADVSDQPPVSTTPTHTATQTATASASATPTPTLSPSVSAIVSATPTTTALDTAPPTATATPSTTITATPSATAAATATANATATTSVTASATATPSVTAVATAEPGQITVRAWFDDGLTSAGEGVELRVAGVLTALTDGEGRATFATAPGDVTVVAVLPGVGGGSATTDLDGGEMAEIDILLHGEGLAADAQLASAEMVDGQLPAEATMLTLHFTAPDQDLVPLEALASIRLRPAEGGSSVDLTGQFALLPDGRFIAADLSALRAWLAELPDGGTLSAVADLPDGRYVEGDLPIALPDEAAEAGAPPPARAVIVVPTPSPRLEVMARTAMNLTSIDARVSINDAGTVAFTARDSDGSKGFVATHPGRRTPVTFFSSSRTFSGAAINNAAVPEVVLRELVLGPSFFIRRWRSDGSGFTVVGKSGLFGGTCTGGLNAGLSCLTDTDCLCFAAPFCSPGFCLMGGSDFDSAASFVDLNDLDLATFPGLIDGSTTLALFRGTGAPLEVVATFPSGTLVRPQIANTGDVVIRDAQDRIVVYPNGSQTGRPITGVGDAITQVGSHPGIAPRGDLVAFTGEDAKGPGVFVASNAETPVIYAAAGAAAGDDLTAFPDGHRVAIVSTGIGTLTLAFVAVRDDVVGLYVVFGRLTDNGLEVAPPQLVAAVGDTIGNSRVSSLALYDPINNNGQVAFWAAFEDGAQAVVRATFVPAITAIEPNRVQNRECDKVFSLPLGGMPGNVAARSLTVSFDALTTPSGAAVDAIAAGSPLPVCHPAWREVADCDARTDQAPVLDDEGRAILPISIEQPSGVGVSTPTGHRLNHEVSLVFDQGPSTRRSDNFIALWVAPELRDGSIRRFGSSDVGGDDWAAAGTIAWLRDMAPKMAAAGLIFAVNDISGEHGINLGHSGHAFGSDLDIFQFRNLRACDQPLSGGANYAELARQVRLAFAGNATALNAVGEFVRDYRAGVELLLDESQPPGAVDIVRTMRGAMLSTAGGVLPVGWAHEALTNGTITPPANPDEVLDLGIGTWQFASLNRVVPTKGHDDHLHVDLDEGVIRAPIPPGCAQKRFPALPAAVGPVARPAPACP